MKISLTKHVVNQPDQIKVLLFEKKITPAFQFDKLSSKVD